jgi:hypothetical protein
MLILQEDYGHYVADNLNTKNSLIGTSNGQQRLNEDLPLIHHSDRVCNVMTIQCFEQNGILTSDTKYIP